MSQTRTTPLEEVSVIRSWLVRRALVVVPACVVYSELVGVFHLLVPIASAIFWTSAGLFLVRDVYVRRRIFGARISQIRGQIDLQGLLLLGILGGLILVILVASVLSVPSSYDSMTYHLPRQIRWIQQQSLDHFPTHILHQLHREPLAELLGAHTIMLTGTDLLVSLVSTGALILALAALSLVAAEFRCSLKNQLLACLVGVTYPIAFLQASSTKVDLVFSAWLTVIAWLGLRIVRGERTTWQTGAYLGAAFGLACLGKGIVLLLGLPLVVWISIGLLRSLSWGTLKTVAALGLVFAALTAGHYHRNYALFGSLILPSGERSIHVSEGLSPSLLAARAFKEFSLHLSGPWPGLNEKMEGFVRHAYERLRLDIDDPRITVADRPFRIVWVPYNEYQASAPVHLMVAVLASVVGLLIAVGLLRGKREPGLKMMIALPFVYWLLLVVGLKWSGYLNPRLHLPIVFALGAAVAILLSEFRWERLTVPLMVLLTLQVIPSVINNPRSLAGPLFRPRHYQLFSGALPEFMPPFERAAGVVRSLDPETVGLYPAGYWGFEYPMMRLLRRTLYRPHFEAFNVKNVSSRLQQPSGYRPPDVVVSYAPVGTMVDPVSGREYVPIAAFDDIRVLVERGGPYEDRTKRVDFRQQAEAAANLSQELRRIALRASR